MTVLPLSILVGLTASAAPTSGELVVEGVLRTPAGVAIEGATPASLCLYATPTGGEAVFCEPETALDVKNGFFQARLGGKPNNALDVDVFTGHDELWLQVSVAGKPLPRSKLETDPFAFRALSCDVASSVAGYTPDATGAPGSVLVVGPDGKIPEAVIPGGIGTEYVAGSGLTLIGGVFSLDEASVTALARAACFDSATELSVALAAWDQSADDDLTIATVFKGDVVGTYDSLELACSGCVTMAMLEGGVIDALAAASTPALEAVSEGTLSNRVEAEYENGAAQSIPTSLTPNASTIDVPDIGLVQRLSVTVSVSHADLRELSISLLAPDGTSVRLADATNLAGSTFTGTFPETAVPLEGLTAFVDHPTAGTWRLVVLDDKPSFNPDGSLNWWKLSFDTLSAHHLSATTNLAMHGNRVTGLADPVEPGDAVSLGFLESRLATGGFVRVEELAAVQGELASLRGGYFGDGSDGDVTIAGTQVLTRDMFYENLTVSQDAVLDPGGFRIYVRGILTVKGRISRDGNDGKNGVDGGAGGIALPAGTVPGGLAGGAGGAGGPALFGCGDCSLAKPGGPGPDATVALTATSGATGGKGGNPGWGYDGYPGGGGGAATQRAWLHNPATAYDFQVLGVPLQPTGGSGGGGGGGAGTGGSSNGQHGAGGTGGGAGATGGVIYIAASSIAVSGSGAITAAGGDGGKGQDGASIGCSSYEGGAGGGGGGGAGGNGGAIVVVYSQLTGGEAISAAAGHGGQGGAGGTALCWKAGSSGSHGSDGAAGLVVKLEL